ncbi:MAG: SpaH/EbpB family LPXTG-anchored major pilin [Oscillospiraceae bacterium]|nr:SpaH/EbpB family LPXTG-anchored major pilin [Oscillospiraceae bacterium]
MKKLTRFLSMCLAIMLVLSCVPAVFAADVEDATINMHAKCSLTIWKYDWTNAVKDGVWNEDSFISTGYRESYVEEILGEAVRKGDDNAAPDNALGNAQNSNGYALKGVEFTIVRVADIVTFTESANDQHPDYNLTRTLYGFDKSQAAGLLAAIGLANGAGRYENADNTNKLDSSKYYYTSDTLNAALAAALAENSTTVKNALETYVASNSNAIVMDKTNENGKTIKRDLEVGLWLVVETEVPEMVTSTTNPFFVSLPMTTVSGNEYSSISEGGHFWNYHVVVYPKNETGIPTLTKEIREAQKDTGKNGGSDVITDGFDHNATGSSGDVMDYQIISTLPTITSKATSLQKYEFYDSISEALSYNKSLKDVKIEFFTDKDCTDKVATWTQGDGKFTVTYSSDDRHMTIDITEAGLAEINGSTENVNGKLYVGYSNYTARVTYTATLHSDASVTFGENGNENKVVLTWKRTSSEYYDTLIDDCHVYTFGIDITKLFSDTDSETAEETGMFKHVKFKIWNETDGYWLTATRNDKEGVYYVTGHVTEEADATIFYPVTMGDKLGQVMVKGMEDDEYIITEVETANGYTLLKDDIHVVISIAEDTERPCDIYSEDVLGVLQNDPHYSFDGGFDLSLANIPQVQLAHSFLTASAKVDSNSVTMLEDNGSENAEAPLTVVNTQGLELPNTGDLTIWIVSASGIVLMTAALVFILLTCRKKKSEK